MRALELTAAHAACPAPALRPLPLPDRATEAGLSGMTATGMLHGYLRHRGGPPRAAVWRDGRVVVLERRSPSDTVAANDVDQVVGAYTRHPGEAARAALWTGGERVDLHPPGAFESSAVAIAGQGEVLVISHHVGADPTSTASDLSLWRLGRWTTLVEDGWFDDPVLGPTGDVAVRVADRTLLFPRGRGPGIRLPGLGCDPAPRPVAVNAAGEVLLSCADSGRGRVALWRDGGLTDIGSLGGGDTRLPATGPRTGPWLNAAGEVTGVSATRDGRYHAFRWRGGTMTDLTPAAAHSTSHGVNERGDIAGEVPATGGPGSRAALWHREGVTHLGWLTPGHLTSPTALHPRLPVVAGVDHSPDGSTTTLFTSTR
ncbi:hypothetical protein [Actinokineospora pegani]|uniref:hypothetical protein n=1 Tax=Actinokineospora pegani TaxID=2654637 RepID=UPI0012EAF64E|nr:hypothetical protein [Actinokineospora pegani]